MPREVVRPRKTNTISFREVHVNKREETKRKRNFCLEYTSVTGKTYNKREIGEDCKCPKNCYVRLCEGDKDIVFNEFWKYGNYDLQNLYWHGRIKTSKVKHRYTKSGDESRRNNTMSYTILKNTEEVNVCKKAFINIHGLQKSRGRI